MAQKDFEVTQGSTFEYLLLMTDVNGLPLNMTSYTGGTAGARGMIRKKYTDAAATKSFTITIIDHNGVLAAVAAGTLHLTTAQIAALQPQTAGKCYLLIRLTAADTAAIPKGIYVYDIEVEDTTGYIPDPKPSYGTFTVKPEATK